MLKLQHPPAQGLADPPGEVVIPPRPGWVGVDDLDASSRGRAGHPWIGSRRRRGVVERNDLGSARHRCSLFGARVTGNKIVRLLIMRGINVRFVNVRRVGVGAWQKGH
jgi:hypothetical protein